MGRETEFNWTGNKRDGCRDYTGHDESRGTVSAPMVRAGTRGTGKVTAVKAAAGGTHQPCSPAALPARAAAPTVAAAASRSPRRAQLPAAATPRTCPRHGAGRRRFTARRPTVPKPRHGGLRRRREAPHRAAGSAPLRGHRGSSSFVSPAAPAAFSRPHKAPLPRRPPDAPAMPAVPCGSRTGRGRSAASGRSDAAGMPGGPGRTRGKGGSRSRCPERRPAAPHRGQGAALPLHRPRAPALPPATRPPPPGLPPRALHRPASHGRSSRAPPAAPGRGTGPAVRGGLSRPPVARRPRPPRRGCASPAREKSCPRVSGRESNSPSRPAAPPRPRLKLALPPGAAAEGGHRPAPPLPGGARSQPGRAARSRQPIARQRGPCARPEPRWAGPARSEGGRAGGGGGRAVRAPRGGHGSRTRHRLPAAAGPGAWSRDVLRRSPECWAGSCPAGRCTLRASARSRNCPASADSSGLSERNARQRLGWVRESNTGAACVLPLSQSTHSPRPVTGQ